MMLMRHHGPEVVISGPAGTGKSSACLWKLHQLCSRVPGMRALIVRKTRESLTESALKTFEDFIVEPRHPILSGSQRRLRQSYDYPNGARIVLGGLDKPEKTFSTEYDVIYAQEATTIFENDYELLLRSLRNGVLPYQQIMSDCNPDAPTHWLKLRCDKGMAVMFESKHEENPRFYDVGTRWWTKDGLDYIAMLDRLTGARKQRLRYGRWVQAEGAVWEEWDRKIHLIDQRVLPLEWDRYWSIDFGFRCPFAMGWFAVDPDGRLYLYRQIYYTNRLVEDHARQVRQIHQKDIEYYMKAARVDREEVERRLRPKAVICDHDAEDRATFTRHLGMGTVPAKKSVSDGIQAVAARLKVQKDGKPRLFVMRDSVVERDPVLDDNKMPVGFEQEVEAYVWEDKAVKEAPKKEHDHAADMVRYAVAHHDLRQKLRVFA